MDLEMTLIPDPGPGPYFPESLISDKRARLPLSRKIGQGSHWLHVYTPNTVGYDWHSNYTRTGQSCWDAESFQSLEEWCKCVIGCCRKGTAMSVFAMTIKKRGNIHNRTYRIFPQEAFQMSSIICSSYWVSLIFLTSNFFGRWQSTANNNSPKAPDPSLHV